MGPSITRGGNHTCRRQCSHKSGGVPMTVGFEDRQALALGRMNTGRVQVGGEGGFIHYDQAPRFFAGNASALGLAGLDHVRPLLLSGQNRSF